MAYALRRTDGDLDSIIGLAGRGRIGWALIAVYLVDDIRAYLHV